MTMLFHTGYCPRFIRSLSIKTRFHQHMGTRIIMSKTSYKYKVLLKRTKDSN